jgi:hypothetical protein
MRVIEFNEETGTFISKEEIQVDNAAGADGIREALKIELAGIIRQVKALKARAFEIKSMLAAMDSEKPIVTDPIPIPDPVPDPEVIQSPSPETPDSS